MEIGKTEIVNERLRYREIVLEANSHVLDDEILDLPSTFSEYLKCSVETVLGNYCIYYSNIASERAGIF